MTITYRQAKNLLTKAGEQISSGKLPTDAHIGINVDASAAEELLAEKSCFYNVFDGHLYLQYDDGKTHPAGLTPELYGGKLTPTELAFVAATLAH